MHPALRASLARDLSPWPPGSITRHALDASIQRVSRGESDITAAFGIYNNTLFWLHPDAHPRPRNPHLYAIADDLATLLSLHRVPDVEFVLNVDDYPKAQGMVPTSPEAGAPRVPLALFSYCKRERAGQSHDYDVLVPSGAFRMSIFEQKLLARTPGRWERDFPWSRKREVAYFRGTPYCGIHRFGRCSRYVMAWLAHQNRSANHMLDVGLVEYNPLHDTELRRRSSDGGDASDGGGGGSGGRGREALRRAERVDESQWWQHKYLLHLDGHAFSNRLQALLLSNSLVLKQQSQ